MNAQEIYNKRIKEAAYEESSTYDLTEIKESNAAYNAAIKVATFILQNQWISVEEALPTLDEKNDFSERYIVKTNEGAIKVMRIFKNIAWCDIFDGRAFIPFEKKIVTHWMPIPEMKGGEE